MTDEPDREPSLDELLKDWTDERDFVVLKQSDWGRVQDVVLGNDLGEQLAGMQVIPFNLED